MISNLLNFFFQLEQYNRVPSASDHLDELVKRILVHAEALLPKVEDVKAEQMGDMIDQEMQQTTAAIAKAAEKIAVRNNLLNLLIQEIWSVVTLCPNVQLWSSHSFY
jgi:hypothetical protein